MRNQFIIVLGTVSVLVMASCRHESSPRPVAQTAPPSVPLRSTPQDHSVQSKQLRTVMDQLSHMRSSLPNEGDVESPTPETSKMVQNVATIAEQLASTSLAIPNVLKDQKLSEADRSGFIAEAHTLHDQALRLRQQAQHNQIERMQRTMDDITATCVSCHLRFREFTGDLDIHRASWQHDAAVHRYAQ